MRSPQASPRLVISLFGLQESQREAEATGGVPSQLVSEGRGTQAHEHAAQHADAQADQLGVEARGHQAAVADPRT